MSNRDLIMNILNIIVLFIALASCFKGRSGSSLTDKQISNNDQIESKKSIPLTDDTTASTSIECRFNRCEELEALSYSCSENKDQKVCEQFVELFDIMLEPLTSSCKTNIVFASAIFHCSARPGAAYVDIHFDLLATLKSKKALTLYASDKFRNSTDGEIAHAHLKKSIEVSKKFSSRNRSF